MHACKSHDKIVSGVRLFAFGCPPQRTEALARGTPYYDVNISFFQIEFFQDLAAINVPQISLKGFKSEIAFISVACLSIYIDGSNEFATSKSEP